MFKIFKEALRMSAKNKGGATEALGCAPSRKEACTRCERSGIWISESMIEDIENTECVSESSIEISAPLVTYFSSTTS